MGADINFPLRVFRRGTHPNENYVFTQILARARFARSMTHAIEEYIEFAGRTIEGFYFTLVSVVVLPLPLPAFHDCKCCRIHHFGACIRLLINK